MFSILKIIEGYWWYLFTNLMPFRIDLLNPGEVFPLTVWRKCGLSGWVEKVNPGFKLEPAEPRAHAMGFKEINGIAAAQSTVWRLAQNHDFLLPQVGTNGLSFCMCLFFAQDTPDFFSQWSPKKWQVPTGRSPISSTWGLKISYKLHRFIISSLARIRTQEQQGQKGMKVPKSTVSSEKLRWAQLRDQIPMQWETD